MFYFYKVEYNTLYVQNLGVMDIFHTWWVKNIPLYNSAKIIKIDRDFPKLWYNNVLPSFYGSQGTVGGQKSVIKMAAAYKTYDRS